MVRHVNSVCSATWSVHDIHAHLMWGAKSLEKILILQKPEGRRRRNWQRMRWLDGITKSMHISLSKLWEIVKDRKPGTVPGSGRSPGEGNGKPLQYSCLENSKDWEAWWAAVHGVAKSQTQLKWFSMHVCRNQIFWAFKSLNYLIQKTHEISKVSPVPLD